MAEKALQRRVLRVMSDSDDDDRPSRRRQRKGRGSSFRSKKRRDDEDSDEEEEDAVDDDNDDESDEELGSCCFQCACSSLCWGAARAVQATKGVDQPSLNCPASFSMLRNGQAFKAWQEAKLKEATRRLRRRVRRGRRGR